MPALDPRERIDDKQERSIFPDDIDFSVSILKSNRDSSETDNDS